jgi:hypothetical protein
VHRLRDIDRLNLDLQLLQTQSLCLPQMLLQNLPGVQEEEQICIAIIIKEFDQVKKSPPRDIDRHSFKCALCRDYLLSTQEVFSEVNCNMDFCYPCILKLYKNYLVVVNELHSKEGIRPELPVEFPCRCEYSESETIAFLQKSCYSCRRPIDSKAYLLQNNTRVMEICYKNL